MSAEVPTATDAVVASGRDGLPRLAIPLLVLWGLISVAGLWALAWHESRPGLVAERAPRIAEALAQSTPPGVRLWLFAHPDCPCTAASFRELDRVRAQVGLAAEQVAVVLADYGGRGSAEGSRNARRSEERGHPLVLDADARFATASGATTSGFIIAADPAGRTLFAGGITPSRGHEGDSEGGLALRRAMKSGEAQAGVRPVFGCPLTAEPREP